MKFLTRRQAADLLGVSVRTLDRLRKDGLLPWLDVKGGRGSRAIIRLPLEAIEEALRRRGCLGAWGEEVGYDRG